MKSMISSRVDFSFRGSSDTNRDSLSNSVSLADEQGRAIFVSENCLVTPGKMKSQEIIGDHAYTKAKGQQLIVVKDRL